MVRKHVHRNRFLDIHPRPLNILQIHRKLVTTQSAPLYVPAELHFLEEEFAASLLEIMDRNGGFKKTFDEMSETLF